MCVCACVCVCVSAPWLPISNPLFGVDLLTNGVHSTASSSSGWSAPTRKDFHSAGVVCAAPSLDDADSRCSTFTRDGARARPNEFFLKTTAYGNRFAPLLVFLLKKVFLCVSSDLSN